jgi:hypothetical protein
MTPPYGEHEKEAGMFRRVMMVSALAVALTIGMAPGWALPPAGTPAAAVLALQQFGEDADCNGDGVTDLAVGAPGDDVGAAGDAGAVSVFFGVADGTGTSQTVVWDNPEAGDRFGAALDV